MRAYPVHPDLKLVSRLAFPLRRWTARLCSAYLSLAARLTKPARGVRVKRFSIPRPDGGRVRITLFEPEGGETNAPCLLYFHGGAFALKAAPVHVRLVSEYAKETPCKAALVDYRLAPEHPFPAGLEDCLLTARYFSAHALELGIDATRIAFGGDSVGGALAAAASLALRDRGEANARFLLLAYPVADARQTSDSLREFFDAPLWNAAATKTMWELYLPNGAGDLPRAYASPLEADSFAGLPDAYVEVAAFDCLRDEGLALADALEAGGSRVERNETRGTAHGFEIVWRSELVANAVARRVAALKGVFFPQ